MNILKAYNFRPFILFFITFVFAFPALAAKPEVVILATGGTIAGAGETSVSQTYTAAKVPVEKLLAAVPQIQDKANVRGEQVVQIASQAMTNEIWLTLAHRVQHHLNQKEVSGIVITHGTDTMEETAFFLSLVIDSDKPVILVGSMRPTTSLSADGAVNLYNAVALAADPQAKNYGVMVVMNDKIFAAKDVTKSHTTAVDTFVARNNGELGRIEFGNINFYQPANTKTSSPFTLTDIKSLPSVDIVYGYANASSIPVSALVMNGSKGIIHAGVGNGNLFPEVEEALINARKKGVYVVRSTRVGSGHVIRNAEVEDDRWDFIVSDDLSPQKARILLMLALTKSKNTKEIQDWFYRF